MRALLRVASAALAVTYPVAIYLGLTRWGTKTVCAIVVGVVCVRALLARLESRHGDLAPVLRASAPVVVLAGLSALVDDHRFLLAMPTLVNLALLATFGASLRGDVPVVERFARMQVSDLSDDERAHCRSVTVAWCAMFVFNATVSTALAVAAPLRWWAAYTGLIAYGLVGALFAAEFLVRTYRFRARKRSPVDRLFVRLFPVRL